MLILADLNTSSQHSLLVCNSVDDQKMQCKCLYVQGDGGASAQDLAFWVGPGPLKWGGQVGSRLQAAAGGTWRSLGDAKNN